VKMDWQVTVFCPVHKKNVYLIETALDSDVAKKKALERSISCPWGPTPPYKEPHYFTPKEVLAVSAYPWKPSVTVSTGPIYPSPYYVPTPPAEALYRIDPEMKELLLKKLRWWERG